MSGIDNKLPVAREGLPYILGGLGLAILSAIAGGWFIAVPAGVLGLFSLWFFRDPDRISPGDESAVLSPADGTVIQVQEVEIDPYINRKMMKISIFMSVFNVHVNRAPLTGVVKRVVYYPGKFFAANMDKASSDNERNAIILEGPNGVTMVFVQIAGLIARRIACWIKPGDKVTRGQRIGLIRFGSRLDVYLPPDADVSVSLGQKVTAGRSVLGYLP